MGVINTEQMNLGHSGQGIKKEQNDKEEKGN